jgi:2-hydroxy-3-oxopropionate reductase
MGGRIAARLLEVGWPVVVYDAVPAALATLAAAGAQPAASPEAVAALANVVITSLPGEREVREVVLGEQGIASGASKTTTVVDMSTLSPQFARSLESELRPRGTVFLDAPVSGGPSGAADGSLVIMVGGEANAVFEVTPVLEALGTVFHCGGPGAGQLCKACNQLVVMGTIQLVAEALVLAAAAGLDPVLVRSALMGGYAASRVLEVHGARMLSRDFEPGGPAKFNLKDIGTIRALAEANGLALPAFEASAHQILELIGHGKGDLDNSALITVLEGRRAVMP